MSELKYNQIVDKLNTEFASEGRRLVFWYDDNGYFAEDVDAMPLQNAKIWHLTPTNQFRTKILLEREDPQSNYLIYAPFLKPPWSRTTWRIRFCTPSSSTPTRSRCCAPIWASGSRARPSCRNTPRSSASRPASSGSVITSWQRTRRMPSRQRCSASSASAAPRSLRTHCGKSCWPTPGRQPKAGRAGKVQAG